MHLLTHFSLQYACTDHLLSVLAPAAPGLTVLDIQHSGLVTDVSLEPLLKLQHLRSLSMAKTFLSTEAMARLVMQPEMVDLPACGYLTDVLDFILQDSFMHSAGAMPKGWRCNGATWCRLAPSWLKLPPPGCPKLLPIVHGMCMAMPPT